MALSLSQLIIACGDDKVQFQNLDQCTTSIDYTAKNGWRITFGTEMPIGKGAGMGTEKLGLVVWLDRDAVKSAIAAAKVAAETLVCALGITKATEAGVRCAHCDDPNMQCFKIGRARSALAPSQPDHPVQPGEGMREAVISFINAHDASALSPDDAALESEELERIGDLRCALAASQPGPAVGIEGEARFRKLAERAGWEPGEQIPFPVAYEIARAFASQPEQHLEPLREASEAKVAGDAIAEAWNAYGQAPRDLPPIDLNEEERLYLGRAAIRARTALASLTGEGL